MGDPVYATREQVKTALDSTETARNNRRIDRLLAAASRDADKLTLRRFYPMIETRYFDWPEEQDTARSWRLWLGRDELAGQPTAVVSGGTVLTPGTYRARPDNGPPFDHLETDLGSTAALASGPGSWQRAIAITGPFGYQLDHDRGPVLAADLDDTAPLCTVTASADLGVGSLIKIGSEYLTVTGRSMTGTGDTLLVPMDGQLASNQVRVTDGTAFTEDEVIMLDAEKMRVEEIAGNTLIVKRQWDGSILASHNGSTVYAPRGLTVERGQCGTAAAHHTAGDQVQVFRFPEIINRFTIAQALASLLQESAGYGRTIGTGDNQREAAGKALGVARKDLETGFYRIRVGAV